MPDTLVGNAERPKEELLPKEETSVEADEKAFEESEEAKDQILEKPDEQGLVSRVIEGKTVASAPLPPPTPRDDVTVRVEKIMEEGLGDVYATLPESAKPKFKEKGELAAREIADMVRSLKIKVKRMLQLIRDWLLTIPGVNRFFLEQEAKIKVDKLIEMADAEKTARQNKP